MRISDVLADKGSHVVTVWPDSRLDHVTQIFDERAIASVVKVSHLVVAGTSNWGAYGIVAELSALAGRPLLHSADEERKMVQACVDAGAVDGLTRRAEPTVDGLPLEAHVGMLELLRLFAVPKLAARSTVPTTGGRSR